MFRKALNFTLAPQKAVLKAWAGLGTGSFKAKLDYDVLPRPHYGFCVFHAARQAYRLGLDRISVAEFGVAGGGGLLELERMAEAVEAEIPIKIDVYGFDTGEGLPEPVDYRDLPYIWKAGFYKMDVPALQAKLARAKLVLGDVKNTVPDFFETHDPAPLGAAFMDLDFWSSTLDALRIFEASDDRMLPRVFCYFDDVLSAPDGGLLNDYVGQLAAIGDYNSGSVGKKLAPIAGLVHSRRVPAPWNDKIYVHHGFEHRDYNTYIHEDADRQLHI